MGLFIYLTLYINDNRSVYKMQGVNSVIFSEIRMFVAIERDNLFKDSVFLSICLV